MIRVTLPVSRHWPLLSLGALTLLAAISGATLGYFLKLDLPNVQALEDYTPALITRVLASDGVAVSIFAQEKRILIQYPDIPGVFLRALVATEDSRFFEHTGIDFRGVLRAAWRDLIQFRLAEGASTLTQQLARGLFLHPGKLWRRKFQEMVLAMEIERSYSKQEILKFYCNQVYMGHGRYGLEAASLFYLGKSSRDLNLPEAALLAGIVQRPESISPYRNRERALLRRNHVLSRMRGEGVISPEEAEAAREAPMILATEQREGNLAPYFVEEVRRWLQARLGETSVYQAGLEVRTTLDRRLQGIANQAVDRGLRQLDKRQGWRGAGRLPESEDPETWEDPEWDSGIQAGMVTPGIVLSVRRKEGDALIRVGSHTGYLDREGAEWAGGGNPASFLEPGDIIEVRIEDLNEDTSIAVSLEQEPLVEGALIAIEPQTGAIRALVGGFDFGRSEFDRAIQARRQSGSAFKPLVYAAALSRQWTAADTVLDESIVFLDTRTLEAYQPENFTEAYYGTVTLRRAIEKSANIGTVKLLTALGYTPAIQMARKLGITTELQPYPSLGLGAFEVSLLELTSAYGTFANQGVRVEPHLVNEVLRRDGTVMERVAPSVHDAVTPQVAYLMNRLLKSVITNGTGRAASSLGWPLAGKTGTTDDNTDAWFVGYAPDLVLGVWVGFDVKKSLGDKETGARAALPIWREFMKATYPDQPPADFSRPPGIAEVAIHRETGLRANPAAGCSPVLAESFVQGTEPTAFCSVADHIRLRLPYPFQRYPLNERHELVIPSWALDQLLATEPTVQLLPQSRLLEAVTPQGVLYMPLQVVPEPRPEPLSPDMLERLAEEEIFPESWLGKDGRPARIRLMGS